MAGAVGGMRELFSNSDHFGYGKFRKNRILTEFFMPEMDWILLNSISTQNSIEYDRKISLNRYIQTRDICPEYTGDCQVGNSVHPTYILKKTQ